MPSLIVGGALALLLVIGVAVGRRVTPPALGPAVAAASSSREADANWAKCESSDADTAIAGCTAVIASNSESPADLAVAYNNRGFAYEAKKQLQQALPDYDRALQLNPSYPEAFNGRGHVNYELMRTSQAVDDFTQAIRLDPSEADSFDGRANADLDLGVLSVTRQLCSTILLYRSHNCVIFRYLSRRPSFLEMIHYPILLNWCSCMADVGFEALERLEAELEALAEMKLGELRAIWVEIWGHPSPRLRSKLLLRHVIAWRLQSAAYAGLDRETQRLLRRTSIPLAPAPPVGSRLTREYLGVLHEVEVCQEGFVYAGRVFGSLSEIARSITGTRWNGPRFFGLRDRAAMR